VLDLYCSDILTRTTYGGWVVHGCVIGCNTNLLCRVINTPHCLLRFPLLNKMDKPPQNCASVRDEFFHTQRMHARTHPRTHTQREKANADDWECNRCKYKNRKRHGTMWAVRGHQTAVSVVQLQREVLRQCTGACAYKLSIIACRSDNAICNVLQVHQ
jgi:hypothetical protein